MKATTLCAWMLILGMVLYVIITAKIIITPIVFAIILAVMIQPLVKRLTKWVKFPVISYISILGSLIMVTSGIYYLLSFKIISLFERVKNPTGVIEKAVDKIDESVTDMPMIGGDDFTNWIENISLDIWSIASSMLGAGGNVLIGFILCLILTYFFLVYYSHFKAVIFEHSKKRNRNRFHHLVEHAPEVLRSYFKGTLTVMLILFVANSLLFWLVGLEYPMAWGALVSSFAFIPYVGTALGLLIPLSYSILTAPGLVQPLAMIGGYGIIQQIEGNIITPKIVGDEVMVNPVIALLATLMGGVIWGVAGAIISIPLVGVVRIWFEDDEKYAVIADFLGPKKKVKSD